MTRRDALALSAAAVTSTAFAAPARKGRIKQSLCSWCFTGRGEKWGLDKLCEVAVAEGAASVELVGSKDFARLKKHNLQCAIASTGLGFPIGFNNPRHRDMLLEKTTATLAACAEAKFPAAIGFIGMKWNDPKDPKSGEISRDDAFKHSVEGLKRAATAAEKFSVTLCIEHLNSRDGSDPMRGHPGYQGDDLDFVCSILRKVGSPRVKLLFDIYHVQIMHGDLLRRLDECKDLLGHVHTAGNPGRGELDDKQEINYKAVMEKLVALKYDGYVGHEFIPTRKPLDGIREAMAVCDV